MSASGEQSYCLTNLFLFLLPLWDIKLSVRCLTMSCRNGSVTLHHEGQDSGCPNNFQDVIRELPLFYRQYGIMNGSCAPVAVIQSGARERLQCDLKLPLVSAMSDGQDPASSGHKRLSSLMQRNSKRLQLHCANGRIM